MYAVSISLAVGAFPPVVGAFNAGAFNAGAFVAGAFVAGALGALGTVVSAFAFGDSAGGRGVAKFRDDLGEANVGA